MLDLAQVRTLLLAERSRDVAVITEAVDAVLATSPEVSPLDIEMVFRDAGSPIYLIAKPKAHHRDRHAGQAQRARSARNVAARKPLRAGGHHGPFMTRGGRRGRPERGVGAYAVRAQMQGVRGTVTSLCTFAPFSRAVGAILSAMLDPKQRHKLLRGDQTKDASWVRAAIEHLMASDPDLNLDEIEGVLRAAASTAYLVATAKGFEVAVGFAASRRALAEAGMTVEQNRLALAVPITTT